MVKKQYFFPFFVEKWDYAHLQAIRKDTRGYLKDNPIPHKI